MDSFIGEIKIVGFDWAPRNWANCDGTLLAISQNQALFSLYGTTFGGDGNTTFALPDLRGRTPIHAHNANVPQGTFAGQESVVLTEEQLPAHSHGFGVYAGENPTLVTDPGNQFLSQQASGGVNLYATSGTATATSHNTLGGGTSVGHENMQPYLVLNFCICLLGLFPPHNN